MRRHQSIPSRNDGKDIGWRWVPKSFLKHWYRTRAGASIAVAHCGIIMSVDLLEEIDNITFCDYCRTIENMRDPEQEIP